MCIRDSYRRLILQLNDGRAVNVDFDQGMGWLRYEHSRDWLIRSGQNAIDVAKALRGKLKLNKNSESQAFLYLDDAL